jgi:hypothetical protein
MLGPREYESWWEL